MMTINDNLILIQISSPAANSNPHYSSDARTESRFHELSQLQRINDNFSGL